MVTIAIYGKGGSGKSMVAANLAVHYALSGKKTFQMGCDPKHDSTLSLTGGRPIPTVLSLMESAGDVELPPERFIHKGVHGIHCVETGGPEPGVGCAGRGIVLVAQQLERERFLETFDVVLLDVLGDVVCGGFAVPLMRGLAGRVAIVVGDNLMSLYAANNIAKALKRYRRNGCHLTGLVANNVRNPNFVKRIRSFAEKIHTRLIGRIPYDPRILEAEQKRKTVSDLYPDSDLFETFRGISKAIQGYQVRDCPTPAPMDDETLEAFFFNQRHDG